MGGLIVATRPKQRQLPRQQGAGHYHRHRQQRGRQAFLLLGRRGGCSRLRRRAGGSGCRSGLALHGNAYFSHFLPRLLLGNPAVVFGAPFGVGQHLIGLVDQLHDAVGIRIGVQVGMVLFRQPAVGLLDGFGVGIGANVEIVVMRAYRHGNRWRTKARIIPPLPPADNLSGMRPLPLSG